jgi:hypothetical protein
MITFNVEGSIRRADMEGLKGNATYQKKEVESARRQQVVINIGALSNKELKPLIEWLSG